MPTRCTKWKKLKFCNNTHAERDVDLTYALPGELTGPMVDLAWEVRLEEGGLHGPVEERGFITRTRRRGKDWWKFWYDVDKDNFLDLQEDSWFAEIELDRNSSLARLTPEQLASKDRFYFQLSGRYYFPSRDDTIYHIKEQNDDGEVLPIGTIYKNRFVQSWGFKDFHAYKPKDVIGKQKELWAVSKDEVDWWSEDLADAEDIDNIRINRSWRADYGSIKAKKYSKTFFNDYPSDTHTETFIMKSRIDSSGSLFSDTRGIRRTDWILTFKPESLSESFTAKISRNGDWSVRMTAPNEQIDRNYKWYEDDIVIFDGTPVREGLITNKGIPDGIIPRNINHSDPSISLASELKKILLEEQIVDYRDNIYLEVKATLMEDPGLRSIDCSANFDPIISRRGNVRIPRIRPIDEPSCRPFSDALQGRLMNPDRRLGFVRGHLFLVPKGANPRQEGSRQYLTQISRPAFNPIDDVDWSPFDSEDLHRPFDP